MAVFGCPVCGYHGLTEPPHDAHGCASFQICPSCGTEFGYDDAAKSHAALRKAWLDGGARWTSRVIAMPPNWDGYSQLAASGLGL
jgi:hypothetical protein